MDADVVVEGSVVPGGGAQEPVVVGVAVVHLDHLMVDVLHGGAVDLGERLTVFERDVVVVRACPHFITPIEPLFFQRG